MHIRPELPADIPLIHAVNRAAFDSPIEANLVGALRAQAEVISLVGAVCGRKASKRLTTSSRRAVVSSCCRVAEP